jgi:uncharacterized protein (DUF433 family)
VSRSELAPVDPRDEPVYLLAEAAHYLALPTSTVRLWTVGQPAPSGRRTKPLLVPAQREPLSLSFWNLVELYVLASMRRAHSVSMQRVRRALDYVKGELDSERPLIEQEFLTNGVDLFVERYASLINVSQAGQMGMRATLSGSLRRIERDTRGLATRMFPWRHSTDEPQDVEIDPSRCFGKPVLAGTAVQTGVLADRFFAGDSIEALAKDYGVPADKVQAAIRWEGSASVTEP